MREPYTDFRKPASADGQAEIEIRRKRLLFLCCRRGTREMDTILGAFARTHLSAFSAQQLGRFEAILAMNDTDIYDWIAGREKPPPELENDVMDLLLNFKFHTQ